MTSDEQKKQGICEVMLLKTFSGYVIVIASDFVCRYDETHLLIIHT